MKFKLYIFSNGQLAYTKDQPGLSLNCVINNQDAQAVYEVTEPEELLLAAVTHPDKYSFDQKTKRLKLIKTGKKTT